MLTQEVLLKLAMDKLAGPASKLIRGLVAGRLQPGSWLPLPSGRMFNPGLHTTSMAGPLSQMGLGGVPGMTLKGKGGLLRIAKDTARKHKDPAIAQAELLNSWKAQMRKQQRINDYATREGLPAAKREFANPRVRRLQADPLDREAVMRQKRLNEYAVREGLPLAKPEFSKPSTRGLPVNLPDRRAAIEYGKKYQEKMHPQGAYPTPHDSRGHMWEFDATAMSGAHGLPPDMIRTYSKTKPFRESLEVTDPFFNPWITQKMKPGGPKPMPNVPGPRSVIPPPPAADAGGGAKDPWVDLLGQYL